MFIRELKKEDVKAVEDIFNLYWHDEFRKKLSNKLAGFIAGDPDLIEQGFKFFVAEMSGEVVGVTAFRKAPEHMMEYATTKNPAEFYVLAVKNKNEGIGTALINTRLEEAKKLGYTDIVFFSGESHQDSWSFHDKREFKRAGQAIAPDGERGYIWRMDLK